MGAPFAADADEMTTAALMVTVRNERGRAMLEEAVRKGRVEILADGGHGGATLPYTVAQRLESSSARTGSHRPACCVHCVAHAGRRAREGPSR